ncbi:MAG: MFS transporter [Candidatus Hydrothermarchaeota archaeon]|nr:MAG: MFS transporter [Candidatus Hydrothermarchaeota archaeon]
MIPSLIQFLASTSSMMCAVFIPNYAFALGASRAEIGSIGFAYGMAFFISSYIFGRAADIRDRRLFLNIGLLCSAITFFLQILATSSLSLLLVRALVGFSFGIFFSPLIAYTHEIGGKMGEFSSYGALGWAFGGILAGAIAQIGEAITKHELLPYWSVFALSSLFFLISFYLSLRLPKVEMIRVEVPLFPVEIIRRNLWVYISAFLRHTGAFAVWIIFPLYLAELGANKFWIGFMYFANAFTQFLVMRRLDYRDEIKLIRLGLVISSLVFFAYTLARVYYHIIPIQFFLALSFSCLHVGCLIYLTERNTEKATSVGILNSTWSISMAVGPLIGGGLSQLYGFHASMYFASLLTLVALMISLRFSSE